MIAGREWADKLAALARKLWLRHPESCADAIVVTVFLMLLSVILAVV